MITIILAFLFLLVIAGGAVTLQKGFVKASQIGSRNDPEVKVIQNQNKWVGGALIGVGVIGLALTGYVGNKGNSGSSSNFGFKFY